MSGETYFTSFEANNAITSSIFYKYNLRLLESRFSFIQVPYSNENCKIIKLNYYLVFGQSLFKDERFALQNIFSYVKMWSKDSSSIDHEKSTNCMEAVLKSCAILLRDDHPFRQFNVEIFRKMNFVKKVSFVLKSDTENVETSNASVVYQIVGKVFKIVV